MTDQIKNFFSTAFSILAIISMGVGLYYLKDYGWDISKFYFMGGGTLSLISIGIEMTRAQNYDGDDF